MPNTPYIEVIIDGQEMDVEEVTPTIKYKLEDSEDFQKKTSSQSFNVKFPRTLKNETVSNSFQNPAIEDLTPGQVFRNHRPAVIKGNGAEILVGKAFMVNGEDRGYEYSFYGDNGDWIIDMKEKTMFDILQHITFTFSKAHIISTFTFNGTNEAVPYVFAPVKFRGFMDVFTDSDANVDTSYLRPSISVYWTMYWAFKSLGYRIQSTFMDTAYFRRLVMPWTWGNFLDSDGTKLQVHKFLAKSTEQVWLEDFRGYPDLKVTNDSTNGAFDNNNEYSYESVPFRRMVWEYKIPNHGTLDATLSTQVSFDCTLVGNNSICHYELQWYHYDASANTTTLFKTERMIWANGDNLRRTDIVDIATFFASRTVDVGDKIYCAPWIDVDAGSGAGARANCVTDIVAFQLEYFRIPIGGTIDFQNYVGFKKYKVPDFLGGVFDLFNMNIATDPINKVVYIEPSHPYSLTSDLVTKTGGYFPGTLIDWTDKKEGNPLLTLYSDYEKEVIFKFKEDNADGITKIIQDRNTNTLYAGKYIFPDRFKAGKKEYINRFFSASAHYESPHFKSITGIAPQLMVIVPENISNTSNSESANTFQPKIAYYKGEVSGVGGWRLDGAARTNLPYMFSVNYKAGGADDPVLSYGDERMDNDTIGPGLLKRFFWQRLAIMRNGQYFNTARFLLNNNDVARVGHREYKIIDNIKYELVEITDYQPTNDKSTACILRKWVPISEEDADNTFPSATALALPVQQLTEKDIKYAQAKCLLSDIP